MPEPAVAEACMSVVILKKNFKFVNYAHYMETIRDLKLTKKNW